MPASASGSIRILFLAANPRQTDRLQLDQEIRLIEERLRLADYRAAFALEQHHAVRQSDLAEFLLRYQPHIVHFSGHGSAQGEIVLEDPQGQARTVPPDALHFSGGLYQGLAFGRDVQTAFRLGSNAIDLSGLPGGAVPQLLPRQGVDPARLFFAGPEAAAQHAPAAQLEPTGTGRHIFISYARADREFVARLTHDLAGRGVNLWIDKRGLKAGTPDWEQALRDAIHDAQAVLLVASRASRQSRYVKDELGIAAMYKRVLFPIWAIGEDWLDCIPMGLGNTLYIDARGERYAAALDEIVAALAELDAGAQSTPPR